MEARFIGDPNDEFSGPEALTMYDTRFPKGEWVDVAHLSAAQFAKLVGNGHFQAVPGVADRSEPAPAPASEPVALDPYIPPAPDPAPEPVVGSEAKSALIAELKRLGAAYDARWGVPKLEQALEKARFLAGDDD